jgi:1-deoxy-D-xylulose-5-phosphate reductoisomerase
VNETVTRDFVPSAWRRGISILGSTGSVGVSTLDVIRHARARYGADAFPVVALTGGRNVQRLAEQARAFGARQAVIADETQYGALKEALAGSGVRAAAGAGAVCEAACEASDMVMAAIVGAAGIAPTLEAVKRGALVALANKECLVAAGEVFRRALKVSKSKLLPVDSEHNAAFQIMDVAQKHAVEMLTLTASGGPFCSWTMERMASVTPEQAVLHPNWSMGAKISVDSATLMNKGLELIEAQVLFDLPAERLDVLVHPQSVIHCLVAYADGSVLAHLSAPDMRTPIANVLGWPERIDSPSARLDLGRISQLTFERPDVTRFPALGLAMDCLRVAGSAPTILNAANEVAVEHFLSHRIGFLGIAHTVERTLAALAGEAKGAAPATLEDVMALDAAARTIARQMCVAAA